MSVLTTLVRRLKLMAACAGDNATGLDPCGLPSYSVVGGGARLGRREDGNVATVGDVLLITDCLTDSQLSHDFLNQLVVRWRDPPRPRCSVKYFCSKSIELSSSQGLSVRS